LTTESEETAPTAPAQLHLTGAGTERKPGDLEVAYHHLRRTVVIRKLTSGKYRLYSRKKNPRTGRRRNLGTFSSRAAAEKHERAVQYFKRH
jgi:hypothetical protein